MRIFLVRHGQSLGNVSLQAHKDYPDHAIPLSDTGHRQAAEAGIFLSSYIATQHRRGIFHRVWTSPYERTRETTAHIVASLQEKGIDFDVREHINICEQKFGLFDGLFNDKDQSALMEKYPDEYAHYKMCEDFEGKFWAPMPLGESRFQVAVRVHHSFGTFHRDAEKHGIDNLVVVCHGLVLRAFLMQWLHLPYEWMDKEPNPGNCWIRLIENKEDKGYIYAPEANRKKNPYL